MQRDFRFAPKALCLSLIYLDPRLCSGPFFARNRGLAMDKNKRLLPPSDNSDSELRDSQPVKSTEAPQPNSTLAIGRSHLSFGLAALTPLKEEPLRGAASLEASFEHDLPISWRAKV